MISSHVLVTGQAGPGDYMMAAVTCLMRGTLRQPSSGHQLAARCKQNLFICRFTRLARARCGVTRKTRHSGPRVTATQSLLSNGTSLCVSPAPGSRAFEGALSQHRTGSHLRRRRAKRPSITQISLAVGAFCGAQPIMCVICNNV